MVHWFSPFVLFYTLVFHFTIDTSLLPNADGITSCSAAFENRNAFCDINSFAHRDTEVHTIAWSVICLYIYHIVCFSSLCLVVSVMSLSPTGISEINCGSVVDVSLVMWKARVGFPASAQTLATVSVPSPDKPVPNLCVPTK